MTDQEKIEMLRKAVAGHLEWLRLKCPLNPTTHAAMNDLADALKATEPARADH